MAAKFLEGVRNMYDCIVVGAGPAGTTTATRLSKAGAQVLLVEKENLPRYKACAGAVSGRAANLLTINPATVAEDVIRKVKVCWGNRQADPIEYVSESPIAHLVMRSRFDLLLAEAAIDAGATLHDGEKVEALDLDHSDMTVRTNRSTYRAKTIVGADGALGITARQSALYVPKSSGIAMEIEAQVPDSRLAEWRSTVLVTYGRPRHGYAWLFPKSGHLSLGIGSFVPRRSDLITNFNAFTSSLGINWRKEDLRAHPIPLGGGKRQFRRPGLILAGDAAGLGDPLSGEGIAHAVHSGILAADSILNALETGDFSMDDYQNAIEAEINANLKIARQLASVFYAMPKLFYRLFRTNREILTWYFELVQGKRQYQEVWELLGTILSPQILTSIEGQTKENCP